MTKYRESKAPTTTSTYDRNQVEGSTKTSMKLFQLSQSVLARSIGYQKRIARKTR